MPEEACPDRIPAGRVYVLVLLATSTASCLGLALALLWTEPANAWTPVVSTFAVVLIFVSDAAPVLARHVWRVGLRVVATALFALAIAPTLVRLAA